MKLKTTLSLLALAVCAASSTSALAQSTGTIDLEGYLSATSCTPGMSGSNLNGTTLKLDDAVIANLNTLGATAGETTFSFDASGCTTTGVNNMWVHFSSAARDGNGRIKPNAGQSQNVRFELLDGAGGAQIVVGAPGSNPTGATAPGAGQGTSAAFTGSNPSRSASKTYAIRYRAETTLAAADAGAINASVTYNVVYH